MAADVEVRAALGRELGEAYLQRALDGLEGAQRLLGEVTASLSGVLMVPQEYDRGRILYDLVGNLWHSVEARRAALRAEGGPQADTTTINAELRRRSAAIPLGAAPGASGGQP